MTSTDRAATTPRPVSDRDQAPGGASCGVRSPYPAPAPKGAEAPRSSPDPGGPADDRGVGPGVPTKGEEQQSPPTAEAAHATTRRRLRHSVPRTNRVCPRFSDTEWSLLQHAADRAELAPGGYTAAAALAAAASTDPNAAVANYRRGIQELMESNRQLGAVGNNLNQVAHFLNAGGQPANDLRQLLQRVEASIGAVDDAVAWMVRR